MNKEYEVGGPVVRTVKDACDYLGDINVMEDNIKVFKINSVTVSSGYNRPRLSSVAESCEHGNASSGSIKDRNLLTS